MRRWAVAAGAVALWRVLPAAAVEVTVTPEKLRQGDIAIIEAASEPQWGSFAVSPLRFYKWKGGKYRALVGVDVEAPPGSMEVYVRWSWAPPVRRRIPVAARKLPEERVTVAPEYVEPPPAVADRIWAEKQKLEELFRSTTRTRWWRKPFQRPVDTPLASEFGLQRIFNGERRSPHPGVDFRAAMGLPVLATNDARVVLAENLYFTGNTVILDHGIGLYSVYGHLSEISVRPTEVVKGGTVIGKVGATGRATGPHLHWGARLLGARVDPMELLTLEADK